MPNKAVSQRQFRLFKGIAEGGIAPKGGLTQEKADEMLGDQSPKGLPDRAPIRKKKKGKKVNKLPYPPKKGEK
jgi:hypothetical protein